MHTVIYTIIGFLVGFVVDLVLAGPGIIKNGILIIAILAVSTIVGFVLGLKADIGSNKVRETDDKQIPNNKSLNANIGNKVEKPFNSSKTVVSKPSFSMDFEQAIELTVKQIEEAALIYYDEYKAHCNSDAGGAISLEKVHYDNDIYTFRISLLCSFPVLASVLDSNNSLSRYQQWEKDVSTAMKIHNKKAITIPYESYVRFNRDLYNIISSKHPNWGSNLWQERYFDISIK